MKKPTPEDLLKRLQMSPLEMPPDWLVAWSEDLPRSHPRRAARPAIQPLTLVFDSWLAVPAGARSGADRSRRLVYRSGSIDVDLEIGPSDDTPARNRNGAPPARRTVRGQILDASVPEGRTFASGEVRLLRARRAAARAPLNEHGDFSLPPVAAGRYVLQIDAQGFSCRVASLDLPAG